MSTDVTVINGRNVYRCQACGAEVDPFGSHNCRPVQVVRVAPERTRTKAEFTSPHAYVPKPHLHRNDGAQLPKCGSLTLEGRPCSNNAMSEADIWRWDDSPRDRLLPFVGKLCTKHATKEARI